MAKVKKLPVTAPLLHRLRFPVDLYPPDTDLLKQFPALKVYPEFSDYKGDDANQWIRFSCYYADAGSAFAPMNEVENKLKKCFEAAGLSYRYPLPEHGRKMVARIFMILNNARYAFWVRGNEMVWQDIEKLAEPIQVEGELDPPKSPLKEGGNHNKPPAKGVGGEKADAIQRAYKLRGELFDATPARIEVLARMEKELFSGDTELKAMVTDLVNTKKQGIVEKLY